MHPVPQPAMLEARGQLPRPQRSLHQGHSRPPRHVQRGSQHHRVLGRSPLPFLSPSSLLCHTLPSTVLTHLDRRPHANTILLHFSRVSSGLKKGGARVFLHGYIVGHRDRQHPPSRTKNHTTKSSSFSAYSFQGLFRNPQQAMPGLPCCSWRYPSAVDAFVYRESDGGQIYPGPRGMVCHFLLNNIHRLAARI